MRASCGVRTQASRPPYLYMARQKLLMDVPFAQAELYLSKITASHFNVLNTKIANQNVLERILIAMLNENTAVENSNTRLLLISCSQGILSSSSFSCYLLLRLLVYMYLSQLMRTFTNYLKCIVISS